MIAGDAPRVLPNLPAPPPAGSSQVLRPKRRSMAASLLWLLLDRGFKTGGAAVVSILLARYLGPADFGRLGVALGLAAFGKDCVGLGLDRIIQRELTRRPEHPGRIVGTYFSLGVAVAVLVALALTLLALTSIDDPQTRRMTLLLAWMAVPQAISGAELWFLCQFNPRPVVLARNALWFAFFFLRLGLMIGGAGVVWFAWVALLDWASIYVVIWLLYRRHRPAGDHLTFHRGAGAAWLREGWPIIVAVAVTMAAERLLGFWVQALSGPAAAGHYSLAIRCAEPWWNVTGIVAAAFLPKLTLLREESRERFLRGFQRYLDVSMAVTVAVGLVALLFAPMLAPLLFGESFHGVVDPLVWLFWAAPALFSGYARLQYLTVEGRLVLEIPVAITNAVLLLAFSAWWIPQYGANGAAAALAISTWLAVFLAPWLQPAAHEATRAQWQALAFPRRLPDVVRYLAVGAQRAWQGAFK